MRSIKAQGYNIDFASKGYNSLAELIERIKPSLIFLLVDSNTRKFCLPTFLEKTNFTTQPIVLDMDAGEENKTIETCLKLWRRLSNEGGDRKSLLINLGGGVVTDLGGFVACTFKRGIPFINIPTSLLAVVDASVGGKTGIDLDVLKNQVGIIKNPVQIVVDEDYFKTLPSKHFTNGMAEMLKHGLILDAEYWKKVQSFSIDRKGDLLELVEHSISLKNSVVEKDPEEQNLRKILNFGHTLGHAIESHFLSSNEKTSLLHGEAIAIGMIMEAYLSYELTKLKKEALEEIKRTFLAIFSTVRFSDYDIDSIIALLKHDKKNLAGQVKFVLLEKIGTSSIDIVVPNDLIKKAFEYYAK